MNFFQHYFWNELTLHVLQHSGWIHRAHVFVLLVWEEGEFHLCRAMYSVLSIPF